MEIKQCSQCGQEYRMTGHLMSHSLCQSCYDKAVEDEHAALLVKELPPMNRYQVKQVISNVYLNSQGYAYFDVVFNWNGKHRSGVYSPFDGGISFTNKRNRHSYVTKYPRYLKHEIHFAIYDLLVSRRETFYECDREGNRRYELRYFDLLTYRATFFEIAKVCQVDRVQMVEIFNRHHHQQPDRHYIDTSAANPSNVIEILNEAFHDHTRLGHRAQVRGKRVKGWCVGATDFWGLHFIAPVHPQIPMTRFCSKCKAEMDYNREWGICEKCQRELSAT